MTSPVIARLRAELADLDGPVRLYRLVTLGQALMAEYYRIGPGTAAAKSDLDGSIEAFEEAYGYLDAGDPARGQVAGLLGFQLAARYGVHSGQEHDQQTGVRVLEEALSVAELPANQRGMSRLALAQLYLMRALRAFQAHGGLGQPGGSASTPVAGPVADADRAVALLRAVLDDEPVSDEYSALARSMLELTEAARTILGAADGDLLGIDFARVNGAVAVLQGFYERRRSQGPAGYRLPDMGLFAESGSVLASLDPMDRPVGVVQGAQPTDQAVPPVEPPPPPPPPDLASLRRTRDALLPAVGEGGQEVWLAAAELLRPGTPAPAAAMVDELVAHAATIVELVRQDPAGGNGTGRRCGAAGGAGRKGSAAAGGAGREGSAAAGGAGPEGSEAGAAAPTAIDAYLYAVALLLRDRVEPDPDGADRRSGAEELLAAARMVPLDHPAAIVILRSLGAFLDQHRPLDGAVMAIAGGFADRLDIAIAHGIEQPGDLVTLHALRCLCRAAEALTELRGAAGTVPPDYPWLASIRAAGELAAVGAG